MDDVKVIDKPVEVMYSLTGWYAYNTHDPMSVGLSLDQLQQQFKWTCNNYPSSTPPNYSLYEGKVQGIHWDPATRYIQDNTTPIEANVAIGNSPAEALAAYFKGTKQETMPQFETLFNAFEIGALTEFKQPQPGQWSAMLETLHSSQFNSYDRGTVYTVVQVDSVKQLRRKLAGQIDPPLPVPLGDALNLLNQYQQEYDLANKEIQQYYWQLFAEWYRIIQVSSDDASKAYNALYSLIQLNPKIQTNYASAQQKSDDQKKLVEGMLDPSLALQANPGPAFLRPNEPSLLFEGDLFKAVRRHGGDGLYQEDGYLVCRISNREIRAFTVDIGGVKTVNSDTSQAVDLPQPNHLIYASDINMLLREACLLNTNFTAVMLGGDEQQLENDLSNWLQGKQETSNLYKSFTGDLPSPIDINWLDGNPWLPLMLFWEVKFFPLMNTSKNGQLQFYKGNFFTGNFTVDINNIGMINYNPNPSQGGIDVDPDTINFNDPSTTAVQSLTGVSILSPSAPDTLKSNLETYLQTHTDPTLQDIYDTLQSKEILMQSLSGFNAGLLMEQETLQLYISATAKSGPVANLTKQVQSIIKDLSQLPPLVPYLYGHFNPLRCGFMQVVPQIIDSFGQRRPVKINNLYTSNTISTVYKGNPEAGIVYLQPRLSQPARLLFRWLAADTTEYDEMNFHPATTPICGWLLTNHLQGGFFIYDQYGKPLGSLIPSLDQTAIIWQSSPGDDATINLTVEQVMATQNPYLAQLVLTLAHATTKFFSDFWTAVDKAASLTVASYANSDSGLGALIGRPLAIAQASLLLEQEGLPSYNLGWDTKSDTSFIQTDNGLSNVQFPVVLGNLDQIDDGLIGYFKQSDDGHYQYSTFYTEAATATSGTGVVKPSSTNLLLTAKATQPGEQPSVTKDQTKVLVLIDPRAGLHVSSGILPTQFVQIPSDQYMDTLQNFEMAFLVTPVFQPNDGVALPLANEKNYIWSWVEETIVDENPEWQTVPNILTPTPNAVWAYTPQTIREGWLRLNPLVLDFKLETADGQSIVNAGAVVNLTLTITNLLHEPITFNPADIIHEGGDPSGSIVFIHFDQLIQPLDVSKIQISANGFMFQPLTDSRYGYYWAATAVNGQPVSLPAGKSLSVAINNVMVNSTASGQCKVYLDYYKIVGVMGNGVSIATLSVQQKNAKIKGKKWIHSSNS